jgi:dihydroxy-acid dehydratase
VSWSDPYARPTDPAKRHSAALTDGVDRAPARAMLKGIGFTDDDLARPLVGVATTWIETMPCNWNHRALAAEVKRGIREAGGTPMEFNTISVSDGVSMGTAGMRASLVSREVIADSIELVARGHLFDGLVCVVGCDKTIPAAAMALARLDIPGLVLYGGSIGPGRFRDRDVTIQDVFEAVGAHAAGTMSPADVHALEDVACPGAGACGGQFTANTMATALDFLGISPSALSGIPATAPEKKKAAAEAGRLAMQLVRDDVRPSAIVTRRAIENAIAAIAATGGSTNGVLHLLAIAHELGIELSLEDFDSISERTPVVADLKPGGRFVATDLQAAGGIGLVARELIRGGAVDEAAPTVDGRTLGELATAVAEGIKLVVVLVQNHGYASIGALSRSIGSAEFGTHYPPSPDLAANAESLGARVIRAGTIDELRDGLAQAREHDGPVVVHVEVDRYAGVPSYDSWWDVPVAQISTDASVRTAREDYERARLAQRAYVEAP